MRTYLILAMFAASLANGAWRDYEEERSLSLDAAGLGHIDIDAGAGSLEVTGVDGAESITVTALLQVPGKDDEDAQKTIEDDLVLTLEADGDMAVLHGYFETGAWAWGKESPGMRLIVSVPRDFSMRIDDGSGSMTVEGVAGDITIDDGSGSISMRAVGGAITIDDGSGSISIEGAGGDVSIEDGSGSIKLSDVKGSVVVDDGSGSINVRDVGKDFIVVDDGSGSVNYSNVRGVVQTDD